jgi:hypothetical protein
LSPPVFLSEEEALQVIADELKQHGIGLPESGVDLESVRIPLREYRGTLDWVSDKETHELVHFEGPLRIDAANTDRQIAIEFASVDDHHAVDGPWHFPDGAWSSVSEYDFKQVAGLIAQRANAKPEGMYVGVFYDPAEGRYDLDRLRRELVQSNGKLDRAKERKLWDQMKKDATIVSRRLLREQVRDFVDWLKAQGVI